MVPFLDILNTMSDSSIPLTISEWTEWGNPNEKKMYEYIASYSPYDNLSVDNAHLYPNLLLVSGLNDSRVQYWEPVKFIAKLRYITSTSNIINPNKHLLNMDMNEGHISGSNIFDNIRKKAYIYAFLISALNNFHTL